MAYETFEESVVNLVDEAGKVGCNVSSLTLRF
jgi:hypothetical protein